LQSVSGMMSRRVSATGSAASAGSGPRLETPPGFMYQQVIGA